MNLEDFKKTKQHSILIKCLNDAVLSGFVNVEYNSDYKIETEKYIVSFYAYRSNYSISGKIKATIKRKDNNTSREIDYGGDMSISNYLKELYFSKDYALGKWIKSSNLDWDNIDGI